MNRAKTKKWVEAKKNAYDGDDWGDYDEYDEYGADQPAAPAMPPPPAPKGYGQRFDQPMRSFTDPRQPAAPLHPARRNSFEAGEEQRAFSASLATSPVDDYARTPFGNPPHAPAPTQPPYRQPSGAESDISDTPQHRRDFNPAALPPPLTTRVSTGPPTAPTSSPFPPRKSSIGQVESPIATSPRARAPSNPNKPLPFVRPSDIYKRHEEDKQRTSMDSARPAIDSLDTTSPPTSNEGAGFEAGRSLQPLETVSERKNQHFPSHDATQHNQEGTANQSSSQQWLPPVESLASFDNDFWPGGQQSQSLNPANNAPHTSPPGDQGFRSVVDQAFVRNDEQRSVPPTPISKSDSGVSRSNTDSTAGISPIMSRVPSGATAALKSRNQNGEGSTPVIVEEIGETGTPTSPPPNTNIRGGMSSPMHSRNISNSSIPLATPASIESPARSPVIAPQRNVPEPESAQISTLASPVSQASTREADIASAVLKNPDMPAPELGALEKESQKVYLASHDAQSPVSDVLPQSRSESPSKGRVQALAGKFGDVSPSRRGSTQSMESWENSRDNSRPSSPLKANAPNVQDPTSRPIAEREASFRPKLPGQWESYATSAATPYESDKELSKPKGAGVDNGASMPLQDVDFTPTTAKHSVSSTEPSDPLMALKVAGAAAAEALQASFGGQSSENPTRDIPHGDVLPRPLLVERTPSAMSSIPPTPPAKDTPGSEEPPPLPPLKEKALLPESRRTSGAHSSLERPAMLPQLSMDPSEEDRESDRLRKEIVASLTPQRSAEPMLQPTPPLGREHDGYFAGGSPQTPTNQDAARVSSTEGAPGTSKADPDSSIEAPSLLTRFSWENKAANMPKLQGQTHLNTDHQASRDIDHQGNISPPSVEPVAESQSQKAATADNEVGINAPSTPPVSPPTGLHVVNSANDPEAVDLPPRLNPDAAPATPASPPKEETPEQKTPEKPTTALRTSQLASSTANSQSPSAKSPTDKPLGFRDIVNMKSSSDRITTYNQTRDYWAHADHGLSAWVSSAIDANPDLASQPFTPSQPIKMSSASIRHRPTGSISLFGKHHSSQQTESGSPSTSHTPSASASNSFYGGSGGRNASIQMQTKGKDFLHTAGVLGGKGMTGAKGLFAKGKSRFKSDKVDK